MYLVKINTGSTTPILRKSAIEIADSIHIKIR